jgi:hypothetical protein
MQNREDLRQEGQKRIQAPEGVKYYFSEGKGVNYHFRTKMQTPVREYLVRHYVLRTSTCITKNSATYTKQTISVVKSTSYNL